MAKGSPPRGRSAVLASSVEGTWEEGDFSGGPRRRGNVRAQTLGCQSSWGLRAQTRGPNPDVLDE